MSVFERIAQLQAGREMSPAWMVGEQLKEICRADPHCAELVEKDLEGKGMGLEMAAAKIKEWADRQKRVGNCVCVPPQVAEGIIREFYGLPAKAPEAKETKAPEAPKPEPAPGILDLASFF